MSEPSSDPVPEDAESTRIAETLDALGELADLPVQEHHARLESAHRLLDELLRGEGSSTPA